MKLIKAAALAATALAASAFAMPAMADGPRGKNGRSNVDVTVQFGGYTHPSYAHHRGYYGKKGYHSGRHYQQRFVLNQPQIRRSIRSVGYSNIHDIRFAPRRGIYTAYATGFRGRDVFLTVDAYSGRILDVQRFGPRRHYKQNRHHRGGYRYYH